MSTRITGFLARLGRKLADALGLRRLVRPAPPPAWPAKPARPDSALIGVADLAPGGFAEISGFGANLGHLKMHFYMPVRTPPSGAPLIVVLHGCGQDATGFARDSGWTAVADRLGVPLLVPEQVSGNNPGRCFNWFRPGDIGRGGEMLSIREMVAAALLYFDSDPARVFVVGLSAGAAMAAAALAAYPDVFAAGASAAGLPVAGANGVTSALARMAGKGPSLSGAEWAARAKLLAPLHAGAWPRLSIWQGSDDHTVAPGNAEALAAQWTTLHGLAEAPDQDIRIGPGLRRRVWHDGAAVVESFTIDGMGHGFPIDGPAVADRFVLPVGVDAAGAIARFWGIAEPTVAAATPRAAIVS